MMSDAEALLADLRSRGITLALDDAGRIRWRPGFMVTDPERDRLRALQAEVVELLSQGWSSPACPSCRWVMDSGRRCPKCLDRLCCDCGRMTGSYFVMRCVPCGIAFRDDAEGQGQ
jgi:hypothetical protein